MTLTIKATIMGDDLGGDVTAEQYERFADLCETAILAEYPDANVTILTALDTVGARPWDMQTLVDGSDDDAETANTVTTIMERVYQDGQYAASA